MGRLRAQEPKKEPEAVGHDGEVILDEYYLRFAALIGITERFLYVYAVMFNQFSLLGGWLVMKAFFSWMKKDSLCDYHAYIFGTALSLLLGLLCGAVGVLVRVNLGLL